MTSLITSNPPVENAVTLFITDIVGDKLCIACEEGQRVYEVIAGAFRDGKNVILSFKNGEDITSAFIADAIGQLYENFPEEQIEASLRIVDIEPDDAIHLQYTIEEVKEYLEDPERWNAAAVKTFGEDYFD